jgi:tripartite-type tricarboxylate transporter receptor subunit TctC
MNRLEHSIIGVFCCFVMACTAAAPAHSEDYPSRPVRLVISYQPGGIVDFSGRVLAQQLSLVLGQPFVVENRPGAGGIVGVDSVAHAAPDGYDLVLIDPSIVTNPILHKTMPFDVFKDLAPISLVGSSPNVLAVTPQLPIKSFAELVAYGNANPGKLNFGSPGIGTTGHPAGEMFKQRLGIDATHVPYKGAGPAYIDLISGKVQMMFSSITGALPFTSKKSIVPLATTGHVRSPAYPDLPTVEEEDLPGFVVDTWLCLFAPAGTPDSIVATLNRAVAKAVEADELKTAFEKFGIEPRRSSIPETTAFIQTEYAKWKTVIDDSHISLE